MKILAVTPCSLDVINDGTKLRASTTIEALRRQHNVELVHFDSRFAPAAHSFSRLGRLFSLDAALLRRFRNAEFAALLAEKAKEADLCYLISLQMGQYQPHLPNDLPCVLDNYNVESDILANLARQRPWFTRWFWLLEAYKLKRAEARILKTVDACVAISEEDATTFQKMAPTTRVSTIPPALDLLPYTELNAPPQLGTMVFIGALDWHVNDDAATWMAREVMPRILNRYPDARLQIVGKNPGERLRGLANPSIEVHPNVESVLPYLSRAQIVLAPLRYGSGVQYKVIQGMAAARPLVLTPTSATGICARAGEHFLLGKNTDSYAAACCTLLENPERCREMGLRARALATSHYSQQTLSSRIEDAMMIAVREKQRKRGEQCQPS